MGWIFCNCSTWDAPWFVCIYWVITRYVGSGIKGVGSGIRRVRSGNTAPGSGITKAIGSGSAVFERTGIRLYHHSGTKLCHAFEIKNQKFGCKNGIGDEQKHLVMILVSLFMHQSIPAAPIPPPPPGNCGGFARIVSPGGRALAYPRATPGLLTHVVSDSNSKRRRFYWKRPVVCH